MASIDDRWFVERDGKRIKSERHGKGQRYRARWRAYPGGPQQTRSFDRKIDAQQFLDGVRGDLARGQYVDPNAGRTTTLAAYGNGWMAAQPWRQSTRDRCESLWRTHIEPQFGPRPISGLRASELQAWATGLQTRLAPATVEGVVRLLSSVLAGAVHDRLIAVSPAVRIRVQTDSGGLHVPLTAAEVAAIAEAIMPELRAAVVLAATVGLRQGELFGLTEDRIRWLKREVVIDRQLVTPQRGAPHLGPCKTPRSVRTVPVSDHVMEVLSEHRRVFGVGDDGLTFHRVGAGWARNRAADAFRTAATRASVDASGWHALRHHAASVLIAEGLSVTAVAATLGHSPAECLKTYAGWWPSESDTVRAAMSRAWARLAEDPLRTAGGDQ